MLSSITFGAKSLCLATLTAIGVLVAGTVVASGQGATGAACPTDNSAVDGYHFVVTDSNGNARTIADLTGNTRPGDTVQAVFTLHAGCSNVQMSLVAYEAPGPTFDANTASQQVVRQQQTGSFSGGSSNTLQVTIPSADFQIDFVRGAVITQLGPDGSSNFYSAQNRLLDSDNGGD
ncbi:MAG: hypothetical protein QOF51_903 [Chloroflexota bacterium]|jgi:hypothetical protein|nr:hypothetical protein [Chloroflexota bacterium]